MKKPQHPMTLGTAQAIVRDIAAGKTYNPTATKQAHEIVRYWKQLRARQAARKNVGGVA